MLDGGKLGVLVTNIPALQEMFKNVLEVKEKMTPDETHIFRNEERTTEMVNFYKRLSFSL